MKVSNKDIVVSVEALRKLQTQDFPIKVSFAITKNVKALEMAFETYQDEYKKLIKKYGEEAENKAVKIKDEYKADFQKDLAELLSLKNDVSVSTIKIDDLADAKLSPADLMAIEYMIEE